MTTSTNKPPIWFWIISVLTLIWNAMGSHGYISQAYQTKAFTENYTTEQLDIINSMPAWYIALFAIAVFSGTIGCVLLLFRKKVANPFLLLSFVSATTMMVYFLFIADLKDVDFSDNKIMAYIIIAIAAFLVWFSRKASAKHWLK